ncbi:MAG: GNAT family N-acetyltransferase, partial [Clostridia bacterium]|nr:GNAT family N-acetyltransferase [Clostridia bacterium]
MKKHEIVIRPVTVDDAAALLDIYRYYVEHTAISFEYDVPTVEEFRGRIAHTIETYP